jgi:hypothetical protein
MEASEPLEPFLKAVGEQTWKAFTSDALLYVLASVALSLLTVLTLGVLGAPLAVGFVKIVRSRRRGEPAAWTDIFSGFQHFLVSIIVMVLVVVAILIGSLFLIVPGLLIALFTIFALPAIAYEDTGPFDAIVRSFEIVKDNFLNVLLLSLVLSVVQGVGGAVLVGMLLTTPLTMIALTVAYERLTPRPASGGHSPHVLAAQVDPAP